MLSNSPPPKVFCQTFLCKRCRKARPQTVFHFTVQKMLGQGLVVPLWLRGLTWREGLRLIRVARSLLVVVSLPVLLMLWRRGAVGVSTPDVSQSTASSSFSSLVLQVGMLSIFWNQWRSVTSKSFVLNMVPGQHLQLRSCPPLFCNFWQFNVKLGAAHHLIIQKASPGGSGFYSSVFVVPNHTGGLWPILNLKQFNCYLHIPSFKMPTIRHVQ